MWACVRVCARACFTSTVELLIYPGPGRRCKVDKAGHLNEHMLQQQQQAASTKMPSPCQPTPPLPHSTHQPPRHSETCNQIILVGMWLSNCSAEFALYAACLRISFTPTFLHRLTYILGVFMRSAYFHNKCSCSLFSICVRRCDSPYDIRIS